LSAVFDEGLLQIVDADRGEPRWRRPLEAFIVLPGWACFGCLSIEDHLARSEWVSLFENCRFDSHVDVINLSRREISVRGEGGRS